MCRLVFKQCLHTWNTCPLLIILFRLENIAKKQHADVKAYPVDEHTIAMLNAPNNALVGEFIHQHPMVGAVLIKNYSSFEIYVKKVPCGIS